jgi:D-beta-D-heptose 7-phosphate kinase/D-beta-D-heptose 1-phosphate adenosyltransferase
MQAQRLLVVGDLILDHYVYGRTERTSPEAPVPIVVFEREHAVAGGGANVARNIAEFGAQAVCAGIIGSDAAGKQLRQLLEHAHIDCSGVIEIVERPTTVKTRIVSQNQQMLRLDKECVAPLEAVHEQTLLERIASTLSQCAAIILSDYAKGVLTPRVLRETIALARQHGVPVFVDPKGRNYSRYRGAFAITPNAREATEASGHDTSTEQGIAAAAEKLWEMTQSNWIVITRGALGVALCARDQTPLMIPTLAREVFDVTGAGDTFIAFLALAVGAGFDMAEACALANAAAGVVVAKVGAATVRPEELLALLTPSSVNRKLVAQRDIAELGERLRHAGKRVVFTNGCFDFLHAGHVALLHEAKRLGDVLVVAINTDEAITRLKGAPRPILKQGDRERLLSAIEAVDYIVVFEEDTPHELLRALRPDVLVKGRNYERQQVEGHEIVEGYGGQVVLLDTLEAISTRELIERHREAGQNPPFR